MGTGGSGQYPAPRCHDPESALSHSSGRASAAGKDRPIHEQIHLASMTSAPSDLFPKPKFPSTPLFPKKRWCRWGNSTPASSPSRHSNTATLGIPTDASPSLPVMATREQELFWPKNLLRPKQRITPPRFPSGPAKTCCQPREPANPLSLMCKLFTFLPSKKDLTWCLLIFSNCRPFRT